MKISIDDSFQEHPDASGEGTFGRDYVGRSVPVDILAIAESAAQRANKLLRRPRDVWKFVELIRFRFHGSPVSPGLRVTVIVCVRLPDIRCDVRREEEKVYGVSGFGDLELTAVHIAHHIAAAANSMVRSVGEQCRGIGMGILEDHRALKMREAEERRAAARRA